MNPERQSANLEIPGRNKLKIRNPFNSGGFKTVLDDFDHLIMGTQDKNILAHIPCLKKTHLDSTTLDVLADLIKDKKFRAGTNIMAEGENTQPALYLVRSGKCKVTHKNSTSAIVQDDDDTIITANGFFGEDHLTIDVGKKRRTSIDNATLAELSDADDSCIFDDYDYDSDDGCEIVAGYSVEAVEDTLCGVLYLKSIRSVIDTTKIGRARRKKRVETVSKIEDLKRHDMVGQGVFGQVWLVSLLTKNDTLKMKKPYALKIQSKYESVRTRQGAKGVVREIEIMSHLNDHHHGLLPFVKAFQDEKFVYMLLGYVPGGELQNRIHTKTTDGLPESDARFYAAGIMDALSFVHEKQIIYRDLKPENVLIDHQGYPVLIDFGFAKHVPDNKTYTRCGSPCCMAPEVIKIDVGYGISADLWSFGCLIHEMITGDQPFVGYATELAIYMAVISGYKNIHPDLLEDDKREVLDLMQKLFAVDPKQRLGVARGGEEILSHSWFHGIDMCSLRSKETPAPWIPTIKNAFDASNFEDMSSLQDKTKVAYPEISEENQAIFAQLGKS